MAAAEEVAGGAGAAAGSIYRQLWRISRTGTTKVGMKTIRQEEEGEYEEGGAGG